MNELAPWFGGLVGLAAIIYTAISNSGRAHKTELDEMRTQIATAVGRVDMVEDRTTRLETGMKHIPEKDDFFKLSLQVSEQRSDIRALAQSIDNIRKSVDELSETIESGNGH